MADFLIIVVLTLFGALCVYMIIRFLLHKLYYYWPNNKPYKIFTTEFDQINYAVEIPQIITDISPDYENGYCSEDSTVWADNIAASQSIFEKLSVKYVDDILDDINFSDTAIVFLLDQSGSMKGDKFEHIAASIKLMSEKLGQKNIAYEILGFSTAGWLGGFALKKWRSQFKFKRPGRLCALHHIIYNEFDMPMKQEAWEVMLNPDILRENIDGEALLWARTRLQNRSESKKILVTISDGAPVDDATLTYNDPNILWDHYQLTAEQLRLDDDIVFAGLGIEYEDNQSYDIYEHVDDFEGIFPALAILLKASINAH